MTLSRNVPIGLSVGEAFAQQVADLIQSRQTTLPKRLVPPGPDEAQLAELFHAAAAAPDHKGLLPWRFVIVPSERRTALADVFAASLLARDPSATEPQVAQAREKAHRAPLLMLVVADLSPDMQAEVPPHERLISAGAAVQNILLMATAQGFGSALTSGKALHFAGLRALFALHPHEQAVCFISIGTPSARKPPRNRPSADEFVSVLG